MPSFASKDEQAQIKTLRSVKDVENISQCFSLRRLFVLGITNLFTLYAQIVSFQREPKVNVKT